MRQGDFDTQVLIVGAGPCGLMLANELGRRGITTHCVDQEAGVATAPQANATQARSMEHYRRLGFADKIRALGLPPDHPTDVAYLTTYTGHELARHRMPSSGEAGQLVRELAHIWNGAELPHRIAQSLVERTLWEQACALQTVEVAFHWRASAFEQDADGVTTRLEHVQTGEHRTVRSRYLFGADGPQSAIRRQLGIRYAGGDAAERDFMGGRMLSVYLEAPAFYGVVSAERAWMYWTFNRRRRGLLAALDGAGQFVFLTQLRAGESADDIKEADAIRLFHQAMGCDLPCRVTGIGSWLAGRALVADRFCDGRVFLGGDAVHLFTPTGGMGYNTAIEDAVNAGWKLAAVLHGQAGSAMLATYEHERRPVAMRNTRFALAFADSIGRYVPTAAIEDDGPAGDAARRRAGAYLAQHAAHEFTIPGFTFGARYDGSPVIVDDGTPAPPDAASVYVPSGKPGGRAPHVWLADGDSLFDRLGFEWSLLCLDADTVAGDAFRARAAQRALPLAIVDLHTEPEARDLYEAPFALIRPDQVVAWRGNMPDAAGIDAILDQVTAS